MIVTTLFGGIGNQMFIYAMARALALRNNTELVLDTRNGFIRDFTFKREYALAQFPIKHRKNCLLSFNFTGGYLFQKLSRMIGRHVFIPNYKVVNEVSNFKFEDKWLTSKHDNLILNGYWANEKYFVDFENEIRDDFSFTNIALSDEITQHEFEIKNCLGTPIAVGVRTYNEISNNSVRNNGFFYTNDEFYKQAMMFVKQKIPDAVFYVFTQDIDWVNKNLDFSLFNIKLMQPKSCKDKDIGDIYLMSICKHYIISNSTFYWWGTWLNPNKDKMVIVPKPWSNSVVDTWIKL